MGANNYFADGQWDFICDLCGKKNKSGNAMKTWDNYYVCRHHKEVRNPQDFVRGVREEMRLPWSRPESPPNYIPSFYTRSFSDSLDLAETLAKAMTLGTLLESFGFTEKVTFVRIIPVTESLPLTESVKRTSTLGTVSEALPLADVVRFAETETTLITLALAETSKFALTKVVQESLALTESVKLTTTLGTVVESLPLAESVRFVETETTLQSLALAESSKFTITKAVQESLGITESITFQITRPSSVLNGMAVNTIALNA